MGETKRRFPLVSSAALIAANLVPVGYVLFQGWGVYYVLVLFWLENVAIGVFNVLRMMVCANGLPFEKPTRELVKDEKDVPKVHLIQKCIVIPFFALHYGIFTFVHGKFVIVMGGDLLASHTGQAVELEYADLTTPILALIGSHIVSFVANYIFNGEYRRTNLAVLMVRPYGRVVALHVTIILGAALVVLTGQHVVALVILLGFKISMDLDAHVRERKKLAKLRG